MEIGRGDLNAFFAPTKFWRRLCDLLRVRLLPPRNFLSPALMFALFYGYSLRDLGRRFPIKQESTMDSQQCIKK
ncbi:MAG: hypothetical protein ACI8W8_002554 [Rhodothermales bacterium]|jgi:hypothetical protein